LKTARSLQVLLAVLGILAAASGYPDPERLGREIVRLEEYLRKAQAADGPQCAPESLAAAQSHLAKAKEEFHEGDLWEAEDAIRLCEKESDGIWKEILGCSKDLDRDGIPDRRDDCLDGPETYNNYMDDDGCPDRIPRTALLTADKIEILVPIVFDTESQRPLLESKVVLLEVARIMEENRALRFSIRAHVDDRLPPGVADQVTEQRAGSVKSVLVELGVAQHRLETAGRGSREPIAANDSSWGRSLNERVEFIRIP
jgi:outer membrane protein OmpA-like peptidoglycan-associated protein